MDINQATGTRSQAEALALRHGNGAEAARRYSVAGDILRVVLDEMAALGESVCAGRAPVRGPGASGQA